MTSFSFLKASALGNDFVIISEMGEETDFSSLAMRIAHRRLGIGCDQVIFVRGHHIRFFNADGSESSACGNGTRAVALWKMNVEGIESVTLSTSHEDLFCEKISDDMARVHFSKIPIIRDCVDGIHVDIGNPHLVYFVDHLSKQKNEALYKQYGWNIEAVRIIDEATLEILVYERGVGPTPSCGTGACAAALAAYTQDLVEETVCVQQPGGSFTVDISCKGFSQTGSVQFVFSGKMPREFDHVP